ncbi:MAG TPA: hypothetical protein VME19_08335 [Streptosporangiaceae bacterium]|nr:hypothetical protein [Streptosporangiaceae bacterium]
MALVSAGVIAATSLTAVALAKQAAAPGTGSVGSTAVTAAGADITPTPQPSVEPSGSPSLTVNAGPNQVVVGKTVVQLAGSVSDPAATTSWSQFLGPAGTTPAAMATFDGTSPATTATVNQAGVYVFQLTAVDGSQTASATVTIAFDAGLPAGTFITLTYPPGPAGNSAEFACTTGFSVANGDVDYELGAKHCIDGDGADQDTNNLITKKNQPVTIAPYPAGTVYASINCLQPSANCLVPAPVKQSGRYETGDMMAWLPASVVPSALVQTAHGLLPVVGSETLSEVTQVCHYGYGSATEFEQAEQCGSAGDEAEESSCSNGGLGCQPGTQFFNAKGYEGDSGGPVYSYDMNNGVPVGVYVIGIVIKANDTVNLPIFGFQPRTVFIPIAEVESRLGVTLLTQAPLPLP